MTTLAPRAASDLAADKPRPEVPPVIKIVRPDWSTMSSPPYQLGIPRSTSALDNPDEVVRCLVLSSAALYANLSTVTKQECMHMGSDV